jgi:sugar/nucleoside kinase (ribokinase family)
MKFGVIGEPCIDFIHRGGKETKSLGGILYSVVSLAVMAGKDEVYPVMNLGSDEYDNILSFLGKFKNIKTDFISKVEHKTRIVKLYYKGFEAEFENPSTGIPKTYDREESSTEPTLPIDYKQIEPAIGPLDALLINMVSGIDISLDTLKKIRKNFGGYIHADLHNIVMKTDAEGNRTQSSIPDWEEWCTVSDTLQMNETEMYAMPEKKLGEYEFAEHVLSPGNTNHGKALVVTRGKRGVSLFRKIDKKVMGEVYSEIDKVDVPSVESHSFKDSTGSGDVFAAAFFLKNAQNGGKDYTQGLRFANRMASLNTTLRGVEELDKLI